MSTQIWNNNPILRVIIFMAALEYFWLGNYGQPFYQKALASTNPGGFSFRPRAAIAAYIMMLMSFYYLILPDLNNPDILQKAALIGFFIYGIFNATNHAIFQGWDLKISLIDTAWGTFLYTAITYLTKTITL